MNDTVRVRIKSETHYHEGKLVPNGTTLDGISARTAQHLVSLGAAEIVSPAPTLAIKQPAEGGGTT
jgi:hypothetical protein